jgi:serine/threonine-protein kinase
VTESQFELQAGQQVGPYTIEGVLGVGGMGRVYRAKAGDGQPVALKVVKPDLARDTTFRKRFDREANIARRVAHPHLVPVLDSGELEGVPYLTQTFIAGGSLAERIERGGALDPDAAVRMCEQVAGALDALHAERLFHRDVKPANILLDEAGTAYITDFGLAKDSQGSLLTRPGQTVGSLDYMAPEQIRGEEVSAPTDVYALGCVLYETLTGAPPFADRQGMRVLWAHLQDEPPDPTTKRRELSPQLAAAVLTALAKDAADRPQSATAYAEQVRAAAGA